MTKTDQERIATHTMKRYLLRYIEAGIEKVKKDERKQLLMKIYLIAVVFIYLFRKTLFHVNGYAALAPLMNLTVTLLVLLYAVIGLAVLLILLGMPRGVRTIKEGFQKVGFVNQAGEAPVLLSKTPCKYNNRITILEFDPCGIPPNEWEDKKFRIEAALNIIITDIEWGAERKTICVYSVPSKSRLSERLEWKEEYLSRKEFELVLGESYTGFATVNLSHTPHILLGGSTGSGKSVLLKLLLMQALQKGAVVCIADFKGGVDFPEVWHQRCRLCFTEEDLLCVLNELVNELEHRKSVFKESGYPNIEIYNATVDNKLPRLVFACDEVAEILDKTGVDSEKKKILIQIENKLSTIARQGRAFGIHLILATQRPDATIISGQIRNNIDFRVCGRADHVLSQIILDNAGAADQIPKNAHGRFITGDGTIFQGYLFDDKMV